jgi:hypothetical protein
MKKENDFQTNEKMKTEQVVVKETTAESQALKTETEDVKNDVEKTKTETVEEQERDPYEGYTRDNPPPWMDEFEYIDFMMTH